MQCQFGSVWLTGLPWQESVTEAEWSFDSETEVVPLIGATEPLLISRGNGKDALSFKVARQFATAEDALIYAIDQPWSLPIKDTLVLTEGSTTRTYTNALLTGHARRRYGISVDDEYEFIVGEPS
jgi:hypothetical protein